MSEKTRIQARARFKYRSDTIANWEKENPVLLSGEIGVAIDGTETEKVKWGDGKTPWNKLGWWKGPKGDKGDKGDRGDIEFDMSGSNEANGYAVCVKELNRGGKLTFWVGTQAEYEAIGNKADNCFYIITDDDTLNDYVVEQGTCKISRQHNSKWDNPGTWIYRKWASGIMECWGNTATEDYEVAESYPTVESGATVYYGSCGDIYFPKNNDNTYMFKSIISLTASFHNEYTGVPILVTRHSLNEDKKNYLSCFISEMDKVTRTGHISIDIKGTWK